MNIKSAALMIVCSFSTSNRISAFEERIARANVSSREPHPTVITHPPVIPIHMPVFMEGFIHGLPVCFSLIALATPREVYKDISKCFHDYKSFREDYNAAAVSLLNKLAKKEEIESEFIKAYTQLRAALAYNNHRTQNLRGIQEHIDKCNAVLKTQHNKWNRNICTLHNREYSKHEYEISRFSGLLIGGSILPLVFMLGVYYQINIEPPKPQYKEICQRVCTTVLIDDLD